MDFNGIPDIGCAFLVLIVCAVPLAVWKAVDIVIWVCHHVSIHAH